MTIIRTECYSKHILVKHQRSTNNIFNRTSEQLALFDEADTPLPPETKAGVELPGKSVSTNKSKIKKRKRRRKLSVVKLGCSLRKNIEA